MFFKSAIAVMQDLKLIGLKCCNEPFMVDREGEGEITQGYPRVTCPMLNLIGV